MSGGAVYDQVGGDGGGGSKFQLVREGWLRERRCRSGVCVQTHDGQFPVPKDLTSGRRHMKT